MAFKIANKLRKLEQFDIDKNVIDIVERNKIFLAELLKSQLDKGLDGDNKPVTVRGSEDYKLYTIEKKSHNPRGSLSAVIDWITNYETGAFYEYIKPHTDGRKLWFDSSVPYFSDIITQSGGIIMKLNKTHLELFINSKLKPELLKRMRNGL